MTGIIKVESQLKFIVPEFQKDFPNQVIEMYKRTKRQEPPSIVNGILIPFTIDKREIFLSSYLGHKHLNHRYYFDLMEKATDREKYLFLIEQHNQYQTQKYMSEEFIDQYERMLYQDIWIVLNENKMSYYDDCFFGGKKSFKNLPVVEVW